MFFHPFQHAPSVQARHAQIRDHAIEGGGFQRVDAGLAASGHGHVATFFPEDLLEDQSDIFFVVNYEDAHVSCSQRSAVSVRPCFLIKLRAED